MIPTKIKNLFEFIDYLDEHKESFTAYNDNFDKAMSLNREKVNFNPKKSFSEKIEYEKLDKLKNKEFDKVFQNVTLLINNKANDLGIKENNMVWDFGSDHELKNKATLQDLSIIEEHLNKYFSFRDVGRNYFNQIFFFDLDRFLIDIADYFGNKYDYKYKEEPKKINDLAEAIAYFKKTGKPTSISLEYLNTNLHQSNTKTTAEPQQKLIKKKENLYPRVFKNNGFNVFEKLHNIYKDKTQSVANYSFLYYKMTKDNLIHCGGTEFIEFLASNFDVQIDRIDSRQSGRNKREDYYNEIKSTVIAQ